MGASLSDREQHQQQFNAYTWSTIDLLPRIVGGAISALIRRRASNILMNLAMWY